MRIGQLRHKIFLVEIVEVQDAMGSFTHNEVLFQELMAEIKPISGNERFISNGLFTEATAQIRCRYVPGVSTKHKIVFGTRKFDIIYVQNKDERNIELLIIAKEIF